ncbi:MAG: hypothetical protein ACK520_10905 [Inhella sp.]|jgi:hypothetical protein|uniref:hypothetical protein n=1 Tax=Inhella sp. TaxID=1921806 RepID=UPI0022C524A7|nr:hypothetical protein [Inhella sp.]MCZ8234880.1 hypothetical protein [Inhella sp.]
MHVLITDAGPVEGLPLPPMPHLQRLLARWRPMAEHGGDPTDPHPPAERALGAARGHSPTDPLPTAAWRLQERGIDPGDLPWALVTPLHVRLEAHQALALSPEQLRLSAAEADALWSTLAPLFPAEDGWQVHRPTATEWLLGHPSLLSWQAASLDRIALRTLDAWLPTERALRRLQNEMQMLLHAHPLHAQREAQGALPVNSVWISGCGIARSQPPGWVVNRWLQQPALTVDPIAWPAAWRRLDDEVIAPLLAQNNPDSRLTLAGETWARTWAPQPRPWWKCWPRPSGSAAALQAELERL